MKEEVYENLNKPNKVILWVFIVILALFEVYALLNKNQFRYDSVVMLVLLIGVFFIRKKIMLHPLHFALFGIFLSLHNLGAFGAYGLEPLGMEFDFYVHSYFGLVSSLILYRTYSKVGYYRGWFMIVAILAVVLGFSAFHEIVEFLGAVTLGEGEGFLFIGVGDLDRFDTHKDMLNNFIGAVVGLSLYGIYLYMNDKTNKKKKR